MSQVCLCWHCACSQLGKLSIMASKYGCISQGWCCAVWSPYVVLGLVRSKKHGLDGWIKLKGLCGAVWGRFVILCD